MALGEPATLILLATDYDGGHKAWVRWPDGQRRHRSGIAGRRREPAPGRCPAPLVSARPTARGRAMADGEQDPEVEGPADGEDRRPGGRARRCARRARSPTNVARSKEGREAALERRNIEAAEQIVTALGTMKGAAMKVGQVLSFLDTGLVPPEHRDEFQRKLARLRDAAPTVTFKEMRKVIEQELDDPSR